MKTNLSNQKKNNEGVPFSPIKRPNVFETLIDYFTQALIQGWLRPGQKLPSELELAEQVGVGRTAIREVTKVLAALGVVTIRQGDGTYIVDRPSPQILSPLVFALMLEPQVASDLYELRTLIQIAYTQLASKKMTDADWEHIQKTANVLEQYIQSGTPNPDEQTRLDLNFHFAILNATHNPLLIRIGRTVEELFFRSIRHTQITNPQTAIEGHRCILEALEKRDADAIEEAILATLGYWREAIESE